MYAYIKVFTAENSLQNLLIFSWSYQSLWEFRIKKFLLFCLSKTICEEFIQLMAKKVKESIMADLKKSGYFNFFVDSTPDISHPEQLSLIIRYLFPVNSLPSVIFIIFFELKEH